MQSEREDESKDMGSSSSSDYLIDFNGLCKLIENGEFWISAGCLYSFIIFVKLVHMYFSMLRLTAILDLFLTMKTLVIIIIYE